jgi:hypothetical protein
MCCGWRKDVDQHEVIEESPSTANLFDMTEESIRGLRGHVDSTRDHTNNGAINVTNNVNKNVTNNVTNNVARTSDVTSSAVTSETVNIESEAARADEDWDIESTSSAADLRRHKEPVIEPAIRPTTFQQFHKSHMKWKKDREDRVSYILLLYLV